MANFIHGRNFGNSHNVDFSNVACRKMNKQFTKEQKMKYKRILENVDCSWKTISHLCLKSKSVCDETTKDSYDIAKNELKFEKSVVRNPSCQHSVQDPYCLAEKLKTAKKHREVLDQEFEIFSYFKKWNKKVDFPRREAISILNTVSTIYSTNETRHPVMTPALIFMSDILISEFHFSYNNILARLLICEIVVNCVSESKKFIPEALLFLKTILQLALPKKPKSRKSGHFQKCFDLIISEKATSVEIPTLQLYPEDKSLCLESKKVGILFTIICQISHFATLYKDYTFFNVIFEPLLTVLSQLPVHLYPSEIDTQIRRLVEFLGQETLPLRHLAFPTAKPKPLKMFEPAFECEYESIEEFERQLNNRSNAKSNRSKDCTNTQQKRLKSVQRKIKKEEKCLLRDIRKTAKTAALVKLEERRALDKERQKKTAKIYNQLAVQEGEFKKFIKSKNRFSLC